MQGSCCLWASGRIKGCCMNGLQTILEMRCKLQLIAAACNCADSYPYPELENL